jgi:hypothetical protein
MFRAIVCSSSGGPNCISAASGTSLSVSGRAVHWLKAESSKHVEASNVIHILQNKANVNQVRDKNKFITSLFSGPSCP